MSRPLDEITADLLLLGGVTQELYEHGMTGENLYTLIAALRPPGQLRGGGVPEAVVESLRRHRWAGSLRPPVRRRNDDDTLGSALDLRTELAKAAAIAQRLVALLEAEQT